MKANEDNSDMMTNMERNIEMREAAETMSLIFETQDMNIFDLFAVLCDHCQRCLPAIHRRLVNPEVYKQVDNNAERIRKRALPRPERAIEPLEKDARQLIISPLLRATNCTEYDLECYTILQAIDGLYDMRARSVMLASFTTTCQRLNLRSDLGYVYPKQPSPIFELIRKRFGKSGTWGYKAGQLRTATERGIYLRNKLNNLVWLKTPPGYEVDLGVFDSNTSLCFPNELSEYRIAVVPLVDELSALEIQVVSKRFRMTGLKQAERVAEKAIAVLRRLGEKGATMVVFAELCVPELVRNAIANALSTGELGTIRMVVAGSFHEWLHDDWYNVAYVLGPWGQELWRQTKLQPYTLMHYEAASITALRDYASSNLEEDICTAPRILVVRDTPLGRTVVLICSDLLNDDPYRQSILDLGVNFIIVPAMTAKLKPEFALAAKHYAIHTQAATVVSNACAISREVEAGECDATKISFAFLPGHKPVRWFRCDKCAGPCPSHECCEEFILSLNNWPFDFERD